MAGNPDTGFKRALLSLLNDKLTPMPPQSGGDGLENQAFGFSAAVVPFGELNAKLPASIRGGNQVERAVQA